MALPVVGFLLALSSFCAATAPDCKDMVKPFMPDDPKLVSDSFSVYTHSHFLKNDVVKRLLS